LDPALADPPLSGRRDAAPPVVDGTALGAGPDIDEEKRRGTAPCRYGWLSAVGVVSRTVPVVAAPALRAFNVTLPETTRLNSATVVTEP